MIFRVENITCGLLLLKRLFDVLDQMDVFWCICARIFPPQLSFSKVQRTRGDEIFGLPVSIYCILYILKYILNILSVLLNNGIFYQFDSKYTFELENISYKSKYDHYIYNLKTYITVRIQNF